MNIVKAESARALVKERRRSVRRPSKWLFALLAAAVVLLTAGCGVVDGPQSTVTPRGAADALVVIAGVHQGMPAADIPVELQKTVTTAVEAKAPVTVVANDGTPRVVFHAADYSINTANPQAHDNTVNAVVRAMLTAVKSARASSNGDNLGGSLSVASDQLTADKAKAGAIIIVDNGLSDLGYPALTTPGLLDTNAGNQVVQFARDHHQMLSLPHGTTAYLVGFGYTAAPQQDLTPAQRGNVTDTWGAYLRAAGATVTTITVPRFGDGPKTTYTSTLVTPGTYAQLSVTHTGTTVQANLPADVLFDYGSAALRGDDATTTALQEAATFLAATPGPVTITGYTDQTGTASSNLVLSRERAISMRDWLVAHGGIDPNRLTVDGKGEADPVIPNATTPEQNQQNRRVTITVATTAGSN
ncbi:OmpA family protein [Microbacterium sp. ASV49]|uniref:OmpA family protein n=1 Tax=Microbacterium candidum TaxID=3041922 RepID=A0ABT7MW46_9MICO|nr:OmpA family protein [Microbacterium sp. ASV49]MDL9978643.1 OmpA family protein [Microbacterium sp. ASV49]